MVRYYRMLQKENLTKTGYFSYIKTLEKPVIIFAPKWF